MHTAPMGLTQKEDRERRIDQQNIFHRVIFFLAAITVFLLSSVLGADDAPFRAVVGKRGTADAAATGPSATGASLSGGTTVAPVGASAASRGVTTAASCTVTPKRCARAARERVVASPRARR